MHPKIYRKLIDEERMKGAFKLYTKDFNTLLIIKNKHIYSKKVKVLVIPGPPVFHNVFADAVETFCHQPTKFLIAFSFLKY